MNKIFYFKTVLLMQILRLLDAKKPKTMVRLIEVGKPMCTCPDSWLPVCASNGKTYAHKLCIECIPILIVHDRSCKEHHEDDEEYSDIKYLVKIGVNSATNLSSRLGWKKMELDVD